MRLLLLEWIELRLELGLSLVEWLLLEVWGYKQLLWCRGGGRGRDPRVRSCIERGVRHVWFWMRGLRGLRESIEMRRKENQVMIVLQRGEPFGLGCAPYLILKWFKGFLMIYCDLCRFEWIKKESSIGVLCRFTNISSRPKYDVVLCSFSSAFRDRWKNKKKSWFHRKDSIWFTTIQKRGSKLQ